MLESGAAAGPTAGSEQPVHGMKTQPQAGRAAGLERDDGLLRMKELAEASGVPAPTIKHYLREGLLPEPVKTSRNMAYYPPEFVERIRLIKRLQEERFMPLKAIKSVLDEDPERARALVELEDRILERALARRAARGPAPPRSASATGCRRRCSTASRRSRSSAPTAAATRPQTCKIIEAISRFRAGRLRARRSASPSTTPSATSAPWRRSSRRRSRSLIDRLAGEVEPERVVGDDRGRRRAAQGPDRRAAHQAAGGRAGAPAAYAPSARSR